MQAGQKEHHHQAASRSTVWQVIKINQMRVLNKKGDFWGFFLFIYRLFNTASSADPSDSAVSGRCWDRAQDCCQFGINSQTF
jgi:hypothetical protein